MASAVRARSLRNRGLSLAKTCSMEFRSGEYLGRKNSLAPAERMSWRTTLPLWLPRLSMTTMSSGQGGEEDPLDVGSEGLAVDRPFEKPWSANSVMAQGSPEGRE